MAIKHELGKVVCWGPDCEGRHSTSNPRARARLVPYAECECLLDRAAAARALDEYDREGGISLDELKAEMCRDLH